MSSPLASLPGQPLAAAGYLDQILAFLATIGLPVREALLPQPGFLPGLLIENGGLLLDRAHLLYPGDVLHEAGHLAVVPAAERALLQANVTAHDPAREGDELAVLPWTYAAGRHLGLPPAVVFHPDGYKGESEWLIQNFEAGRPLGLPLLVWMGLTTTEEFPRMRRWLRA